MTLTLYKQIELNIEKDKAVSVKQCIYWYLCMPLHHSDRDLFPNTSTVSNRTPPDITGGIGAY